mmetsp:Transcript_24703/g.57987  ORF Transcript_24703/g.57987 Transcript_24703/m.57987 type:complete len:357 (-) Transcript_24703:98-1168(-)
MDVSNNGVSDKPQITVILLSGLPASGKSTLARKLEKRFNVDDDETEDTTLKGNKSSRLLLHIEYDGIEDSILSSGILEGNGRAGNVNEFRRRDAWNQARQNAVDRMEQHIQDIMAFGGCTSTPAPRTQKSLINKNNIIILMDDNFHLRGMRKKIHRLLLNYRPIRFGLIFLETPVDICLKRNRKRSGRRQLSDDILLKMSTIFEPPRAIWELSSAKRIVNYYVTEDGATFKSEFEEIVKFIEDCPTIVNVLSDDNGKVNIEKQEADRVKTLENQAHALDQLLRSYVGRVASFDKSFAKEANFARKKVMEELRIGRIDRACIKDTFLDFFLSKNMNEHDSSRHSMIRSQLREILHPL